MSGATRLTLALLSKPVLHMRRNVISAGLILNVILWNGLANESYLR